MPSPIELALVAAIRANLPPRTCLFDYTATTALALRLPDDRVFSDWQVHAEDENFEAGFYGDQSIEAPHFCLFAQVQLESYRADLVLKSSYSLVLVECDGHDWHERTKQQAAYDRERDRFFLAQGVPTARFTGSEIVHYPEKCCRELFAIVNTFSRIGTALGRNGFNGDGTSYRDRPTTASAELDSGLTVNVHWNPGRPPESGG